MDYAAQVRTFVVDNFLLDVGDTSFGDDDSFLDNGIIDSTGILEVVGWIEKEFGLQVPDSDLVPENFDSVGRLAGYLQRKIAARSTP
jgi:acyl carrier protein